MPIGTKTYKTKQNKTKQNKKPAKIRGGWGGARKKIVKKVGWGWLRMISSLKFRRITAFPRKCAHKY